MEVSESVKQLVHDIEFLERELDVTPSEAEVLARLAYAHGGIGLGVKPSQD